MAFVALFAFSGFESTFAELVEDRFHYSIASTGAIFTVIGLGLVFVQAGLIHPVQAKLGCTGDDAVRVGCNAVGLALVAVDGGWVSLVPALLLLVLGQGLVSPTLSAALAGEVGGERTGTPPRLPAIGRLVLPVRRPFAAGGCTSTSGSRRRTSSGRRWS